MDSVGERIDIFMDSIGISAIEMAEYLGVSRSYIYEMKRGKSNPSVQLLNKLAEMETPLGKLNLHWLLTGAGEMFQEPITPETPKIKMIFDMIGSELDDIVGRIENLESQNAQIAALRAEVEELKKKQ